MTWKIPGIEETRKVSSLLTHRQRTLHVLGSTLLMLLSVNVFGQKPKTNPLAPKAERRPQAAEQIPSGTHQLTESDLEAFLAGMMPLQLEREDIAGAVIAVVKDGKPFFAKGYGYSNVEKRTPVLPDATLFRPGSISKLFNWTSIMQQVEQGKLDLDRDVNDYIDFKIPPTFGKPITLRNIMTHTPGFEETIQELFVGNASQLKPLDEYLKEHLPARIFPPGTTPAYSNYATALAGYILQRVSGESFDDYIDHHIFQPLQMSHCTTRQPLPNALKPLMSNGYELGSEPAKPFEWVEAAPAGSSSVTAADMQHFMIAHLQNGKYEGTQILRPETARLMHSRQLTIVPDMNGMALGFYEETRNGHRIIGHAGDTQYFHSDLHLVPDAGLGFFISYNSTGKGGGGLHSPRIVAWHAFLDRYFPYEAQTKGAPANTREDAQEVSGRYLVSRREETTLLKGLWGLFVETRVFRNSDGTVSVSGLNSLNGNAQRYREVAPLLFREVNGQDRIAFKRDDSGRLVLMIDYPVMVFQRVPWYESSVFNLALLIGASAVFLLTLLLWPLA